MKCRVDYCFEEHRTKGYCGKHYTSLWRHGNPIWVDASPTITTNLEDYKVCTKCHVAQPLDSFHTRVRNGVERIDGSCKACITSQSLDYRQNRRPDHVAQKIRANRAKTLALKNYGKDGLAVRERMEAGDPCEICGDTTAKMAIDHCHDSGKVRGLLCSNCNTALGLLKEDVERMKSMIRYIETHQLAKRK